MTAFKARDILNGLERKGFLLSEGDHKHLVFYFNGKKTTIRTKISHGARDIDDYLINLMSLQVKLDKNKFIKLFQCPLSIEDYIAELKSQGISLT